MIDNHVQALKSLNAIKLDWDRNDEINHIRQTCLEFSRKLEQNNIKHFAEEYVGGHVSMLGSYEGRFYTEMFPFFDTYLKFQDYPGSKKAIAGKKRWNRMNYHFTHFILCI